jgi:hypothetical protein
MGKINYGSKSLEYRIQRGKRKKTVAIHVTSPTQVVVLAPFSLDKEKIREIVKKKAHWIIEKQKHFKKLELLYPKREFTSGEQFLFLGKRYRLKILNGEGSRPNKLELSGRRIFVTISSQIALEERKRIVKSALSEWYFSEAQRIITERTSRYDHFIEVTPIVMAPISILDYVIVHELCHLKIKNHSYNFWKLVSLAISDYQKRREWLKKNSQIFRF